MKINKPICLGFVLLSLYGGNVHAQDYVTKFQYDARGRLVKVSDGGTNEIYYNLDDAGNRLDVSDSPSQPILPIITSFSCPSTVNSSGASITVTWLSTDTTHCTLIGSNINHSNLPTSGSQSIRIFHDTSVILTCLNGGDSDTQGKLVRLVTGGGGGMNKY